MLFIFVLSFTILIILLCYLYLDYSLSKTSLYSSVKNSFKYLFSLLGSFLVILRHKEFKLNHLILTNNQLYLDFHKISRFIRSFWILIIIIIAFLEPPFIIVFQSTTTIYVWHVILMLAIFSSLITLSCSANKTILFFWILFTSIAPKIVGWSIKSNSYYTLYSMSKKWNTPTSLISKLVNLLNNKYIIPLHVKKFHDRLLNIFIMIV